MFEAFIDFYVDLINKGLQERPMPENPRFSKEIIDKFYYVKPEETEKAG